MTGLSAADMAGMKTCIQAFMPNTVTNQRTGVTLPCQVGFEKAQLSRLEAVPFWLHTPKWRVTVPLAFNGVPVDIAIGDRLVEPIKGTYAVTEVESPDSYAISINTYSALLHPTGGTIIIPNQTLQFRTTRSGVTQMLSLDGRCQPLSISAKAELLGQDFAQQLYEIVWDTEKTFADGTTPHAGDMVLVPAISPEWLPMHEPSHYLDVLPYSSALVSRAD